MIQSDFKSIALLTLTFVVLSRNMISISSSDTHTGTWDLSTSGTCTGSWFLSTGTWDLSTVTGTGTWLVEYWLQLWHFAFSFVEN